MNKYDAALNLAERNNLTVIIQMIKPESRVLEFGPATGRLTRYLKEELNCKVYIVELDDEAFNKALSFSEKGVLGDIESYTWAKEFEGLEFDYIIFSDVLEHLKNPEKALSVSKTYLNDQGRLLISIPNISHNAVISDLIFDKCNYQDIGILDNTHLKYFTYDSASKILEKCGYSIEKDDCIRVARPIEFDNSIDLLPEDVANYLYNRLNGNVYQILFCCVKTEFFHTHYDQLELDRKFIQTGSPFANSALYIDCGQGFDENHSIIAQNEGNGFYCSYYFDLTQIQNIKKIRWDPIEDVCCKCHITNIYTDAVIHSVIPKNTNTLNEDKYEFLTTDPFFEISGDFKSSTYIKFEAELEISGVTEVVKKLNSILYSKDLEIITLTEYARSKDAAINTANDAALESINAKNIELENYGRVINEMKNEINRLNKYISLKEKIIYELNQYIAEKDLTIKKLNDCIIDKENVIAELTKSYSALNGDLSLLRSELEQIKNMSWWESISWIIKK